MEEFLVELTRAYRTITDYDWLIIGVVLLYVLAIPLAAWIIKKVKND